MRFFRKRRPQHRVTVPARLDVSEALVASWHGLGADEWRALPAIVKVDHREAFYRAQGFAS